MVSHSPYPNHNFFKFYSNNCNTKCNNKYLLIITTYYKVQNTQQMERMRTNLTITDSHRQNKVVALPMDHITVIKKLSKAQSYLPQAPKRKARFNYELWIMNTNYFHIQTDYNSIMAVLDRFTYMNKIKRHNWIIKSNVSHLSEKNIRSHQSWQQNIGCKRPFKETLCPMMQPKYRSKTR